MTSVAIKVIQFFDEAECARNNFTMNQAIDLLRGKKVGSKFPINKTIMNDYSGCQSKIREDELRRLILKLLVMSALEEEFVQMKAGPTIQLIVYLRSGKNAFKVKNGRYKVNMSQGLDVASNLDFQDSGQRQSNAFEEAKQSAVRDRKPTKT